MRILIVGIVLMLVTIFSFVILFSIILLYYRGKISKDGFGGSTYKTIVFHKSSVNREKNKKLKLILSIMLSGVLALGFLFYIFIKTPDFFEVIGNFVQQLIIVEK